MNTLRVCGRKSVAQPREAILSIPFLGTTLAKRRSSADEDLIQRFDVVLEVDRRDSKRARRGLVAIMILLFAASFCFVIQPYGLPLMEDLNVDSRAVISDVQITPETAFLFDNQDGTYSLFVNNEYWHDTTKEDIKGEVFRSIPIVTADPN